jgi:hypothetical protein
MVDTLVAFGCSNTHGDEAVADKNIGVDKEKNIFFAYPFFLSKKLGCKTYHNYARVGASNHEIATTIISHIDKYTPAKTFIIIGWTDNNRAPVLSYTKRSYKILQKLFMTLPALKKLKYYSKYKNLISPNNTKIVTLSKGVVRIIYAKLFGISQLKDHEKYAYETNIKPYFKDEFVTGFANHIFNTHINDESNDLYRIAIERILNQKGFKYLMLTTMSTQQPYSCFFSNCYYLWKKTSNYISIIHEYGSKYGMAESGVHMKTLAHRKLADFLYTEIKRRDIL